MPQSSLFLLFLSVVVRVEDVTMAIRNKQARIRFLHSYMHPWSPQKYRAVLGKTKFSMDMFRILLAV